MPSHKSEHRRSSKPLMEKRRRARINQSLTELKSFILETAKKENCRRSKLEKADILELTVKHLQNLHKLQANDGQDDTNRAARYVAGFNECANEVSKFISSMDGLDNAVQGRLLNHLETCMKTLNTTSENKSAGTATSTINSSSRPSSTALATCPPLSSIQPSEAKVTSDCRNNNNIITASATTATTTSTMANVISGFQVITTSRLPSGDVALIVPSNAINQQQQQKSDVNGTGIFTFMPISTVTLSSPVFSSDSETSHSSSSPGSDYWQPEQTSPLALSSRNGTAIHNVQPEKPVSSCVWRPW